MAKNRLNLKNRRSGHTFAAKPHHIFRADTKNGRPSLASVLTHKAAHLLDNLAAQLNGKNNGDLSAAPEITKLYGWTSQGSVHSALTELLAYGFIELTRQGGRNKCSLYAVTWLAIDECGGKLDVSPTRLPSNLWKLENQGKIDPRYRRKYFTKAEKSDCETEVNVKKSGPDLT